MGKARLTRKLWKLKIFGRTTKVSIFKFIVEAVLLYAFKS